MKEKKKAGVLKRSGYRHVGAKGCAGSRAGKGPLGAPRMGLGLGVGNYDGKKKAKKKGGVNCDKSTSGGA